MAKAAKNFMAKLSARKAAPACRVPRRNRLGGEGGQAGNQTRGCIIKMISYEVAK